MFGAGSAIRPGPLQRAGALGLWHQLLAMDVVDAEGLDDEAAGEERTEGKLIQFVMSYFLSSNTRVNFPFKDLLKICSVFQRMHYVCVSISFPFRP